MRIRTTAETPRRVVAARIRPLAGPPIHSESRRDQAVIQAAPARQRCPFRLPWSRQAAPAAPLLPIPIEHITRESACSWRIGRCATRGLSVPYSNRAAPASVGVRSNRREGMGNTLNAPLIVEAEDSSRRNATHPQTRLFEDWTPPHWASIHPGSAPGQILAS
jgi:hypothetical protein